MTEMNMILLYLIVDSGQVYWLVVMDTQQKIRIIGIVLLGATIMRTSKRYQLKYMELNNKESDAKRTDFL